MKTNRMHEIAFATIVAVGGCGVYDGSGESSATKSSRSVPQGDDGIHTGGGAGGGPALGGSGGGGAAQAGGTGGQDQGTAGAGGATTSGECANGDMKRVWIECPTAYESGCLLGGVPPLLLATQTCQTGTWGPVEALDDCADLLPACDNGSAKASAYRCLDNTVKTGLIHCSGGLGAQCAESYYGNWPTSSDCSNLCTVGEDACTQEGESRSCEARCGGPNGELKTGVQTCRNWCGSVMAYGPCLTGDACTTSPGAGGTSATTTTVCTPGEYQTCPCAGGGNGVQQCDTSGEFWGNCDGCGSETAGTGGTSGSGGTAGTGGTSGSGGIAGTGGTSGAYQPWDGHWVPTGNMGTPRFDHVAVELHDGSVLVAGGRISNCEATASAEVFDPTSGAWSTVAPMARARSSAEAVVLTDGRVLVVGGNYSSSQGSVCGLGSLDDAELYTPWDHTWATVGAPAFSVGSSGTLTALPDGGALLTTQWGSASFHPGTGVWSTQTTWPSVQWTGNGIALGGGDSLFFGVMNTATSTEIHAARFAHETASWADLLGPIAGNQFYRGVAAVLDDGRVLWSGGHCGPGCAVVPDGGGWHAQGCSENCTALLAGVAWVQEENAPFAFGPTLTPLPGAAALRAGGNLDPATSAVDVFGSDGGWHSAPPMAVARTNHTATRLTTIPGVLVAGGFTSGLNGLTSAELYIIP